MKTISQFSLLFLFLLCCHSAAGQEKCKVLKPELAGSYNGKCKEGLANGKGSAIGTDRYDGQFLNGLPDGRGTYIWSSGESYKGYWRVGKRNGEGEYTFLYEGKDSTIAGIWENDQYKGPKFKKPQIIYKASVERYRFQKTGNIKNRVLIDVYQNGSRNDGITNLMMSSSSGYNARLGRSFGFDEVTFPVSIRLTYTTWNKLKTSTYLVEFEFEIFEPGDWIVDLHN